MNRRYASLAALWFGLQFVWGAILAVSLQARSVELAPVAGLRAYAVVAALGALAGTLTQLAVGPLADRLFARVGNRRAFYVAGVAIAVPALAWFFSAPSFPQLIGAFLVLQIGMNLVTGPYQAIVPDYVAPERVGAASAWMGIFAPLGNACGLLVAGFIPNPHIVALTLVAGLAVACAITVGSTRRLRAQVVAAAPFRIDPTFRTLLASRMAINVGFYTLLGFLFFFVGQSLAVTGPAVRVQTALLFLTFTVANTIGAIVGAKPVDRLDKRAVVLGANGVVALGLIMLALSPTIAFAYVAAAVAGVAWGTYFIADWALACTLLPRSAMASSMGIWNVAATVPQIIAPLVTAPIVERVNASTPGAGPRLAIVLAIVEFTLGALWLYRLPKPQGAAVTLPARR